METIYCDLDGVLANFIQGSIEACDLSISQDDVKTWNFFRPYMPAEEFWKKIHEQKYFWEDLQLYPWAHELVDMLKRHGDVVFCTDPSHDDESATGKICWLKRHGFVKPGGKNYVLTAEKWRLSKPGTVLVDDSVKNCYDFSTYGGLGITFPQPWSFAVSGFHNNHVRYIEELIEATRRKEPSAYGGH